MPGEIHNDSRKEKKKGKKESLNRLMISKEIGAVNKNFARKTSISPCGFTDKPD